MIEQQPFHPLINSIAEVKMTAYISTLQEVLMGPEPAHKICQLEFTIKKKKPLPPIPVCSFQAAEAKMPKDPGFGQFIRK